MPQQEKNEMIRSIRSFITSNATPTLSVDVMSQDIILADTTRLIMEDSLVLNVISGCLAMFVVCL